MAMTEPLPPIESITLALPPSCIEFCPLYPDHFCVGTYNLERDEETALGNAPQPQNRNGSVILFRLLDKKIHCLQTIVQPSAVLDLHFQQVTGRQDIFAVASSTATLSIFRLALSTGCEIAVEPLSNIRIPGVGSEVLFLSCAWHPTIPDLAAVSTSTGSVYILALDKRQQAGSISQAPILVHSLEAWTVTFSPDRQGTLPQLAQRPRGLEKTRSADPTDANHDNAGETQSVITVYSGGDDSALRYTSFTLNIDLSGNSSLSLQTRYDACRLAGHAAGVTAVLPVALVAEDGGHIVVTGSYDDHIRVFSIQSPADAGGLCRAKRLAEENLGGGVWRLKLISLITTDEDNQWTMSILVSCMHAGARVVNVDGSRGGSCRISIVARFEEHQSMNYGCDFQPNSSLLCASTSFYDKLLCLWEMQDAPGWMGDRRKWAR